MQPTLQAFPLSPQQQRLWSRQTNTPAQAVLDLRGPLQGDRLQTALQTLVDQHEILRTQFVRPAGFKLPVQAIAERGSYGWQTLDLASLAPEVQRAKLQEWRQATALTPMDLAQGPNLQATLVNLGDEHHALLLTLPALCADSATLQNLGTAIAQAYAQEQAPLPPTEIIQYSQFAEWQQELLTTPEATTGQQFWQQQHLESTPPLPYAQIPGGKPEADFHPQVYRWPIAEQIREKLSAIAQTEEASLAAVLLSGWQVLLWRLTGGEAIAIHTRFDHRNYPELADLLGLLAKFLPLKASLAADFEFTEVVQQTEATLREAQRWQEYFVWEQDDDSRSANPPTKVGFAFEVWPQPQRAAEVCFALTERSHYLEPLPLQLTCVVQGETLGAELHYDASYFSAEVIQRLAAQFQLVLAQVAQQPQQILPHLNLLTPADQQWLAQLNQTHRDYPQQQTIQDLFAAQATRTPEAIALVCEDQQLTYAELNRRANQLAHVLQRLGVGPEVAVGIYLERSPALIVAMLGILKAGGAYLPLDSGLPAAAALRRLNQAQVQVLLTQPSLGHPLVALPDPLPDLQLIDLEPDGTNFGSENTTNPSSQATAEHLAYVLFTSGSTGEPKGVAVEQRQLLNYLHAIQERLDLTPGTSFATVSTLAADLGNTAIFPALCGGGCLHLLTPERATDPTALAAYCQQHAIDVLKIVPSHLAALLSSPQAAQLLPRQHLILGGEPLHWSLVAQIQALAPRCQIWNHYGPTETTVGVLTYPVREQDDATSATVPLGYPLGNILVYLRDRWGQPVPPGLPGEIYIGGAGVARGYYHQPDLTAAKFIPNPWHQGDNQETSPSPPPHSPTPLPPHSPTPSPPHSPSRHRLYKTGDWAYRQPDGSLVFLGRQDQQVKIRGYRLELGEIETVLNQHPAVRQAVVILHQQATAPERLIAYIVPAPQATPEALREFLADRLPDYMLPAAIVLLKTLPLTANGKVDRRALPAPDTIRPELAVVYTAPRSGIEQTLAEIWATLLGLERVGIHDNFFDLGGHSLLATQLVSRIRNQFQIEFPLTAFFANPTIADLAVQITQEMAESSDRDLLAETLAELEQLSEAEVAALLGSEGVGE